MDREFEFCKIAFHISWKCCLRICCLKAEWFHRLREGVPRGFGHSEEISGFQTHPTIWSTLIHCSYFVDHAAEICYLKDLKKNSTTTLLHASANKYHTWNTLIHSNIPVSLNSLLLHLGRLGEGKELSSPGPGGWEGGWVQACHEICPQFYASPHWREEEGALGPPGPVTKTKPPLLGDLAPVHLTCLIAHKLLLAPAIHFRHKHFNHHQ